MTGLLRAQPHASQFPRWGRLVFGFFLAMFALSAWAQVAVPELSHRVTDLTATLSTEQANALENKLATFEARKGSQIAVLIVPTTQPEDIAQFGIRVADQWKIGRENIDDWVLLIVAKDDRRTRIEIGYGFEGAIPDAIAKRVIAETITPYFKVEDFNGGIEAGIRQLMGLIEGESLPPPSKQSDGEEPFVLLIFGGVIAGWLLSAMMSRPAAGGVAALGSGVVGALLLGLTPVVLLVAVFVFAGVASGFRSGGGWSSGGGGGFGGGGGGFGGGGGSWSGGGGRGGGGGASGSW